MNDLTYAGKRHSFGAPQHQHESWELFYCTGSSGSFTFDAQELPFHAGDVVVIPPHIPHALTSPSGAEHYYLYLSDTALSFRTPLLLADDNNHSILHLFADAYFLFQHEPESSTLLAFYGQLICQHISKRRLVSPQNQLVEDIAQNIAQNFANPNYELDSLLRSAPYCYDYLCRLFRQEMHTTPHKYLSDLRLQSAAELLCTGSRSITEVARMCGHHDPLYFSRMFKKKYGCSPREYAKRSRSE